MDWQLVPSNVISPKEDNDKEIKEQSPPIAAEFDDSKLLRAVKLSQTRAGEAEVKAMLASKESEEVTSLLLLDALKLSAHQRWVKLLEIEISMLQRRRRLQRWKEDEEEDCVGDFALLLGIAGVGLAYGIAYYLFRYRH
ncbi:uncharacterized protein [Typha angustifolia]|uniref:uncharacterized protein n=1 Tax=Typha angustifolia TaxID=59011 RepID=UPI003C30DBD6